MTQDPAEASRTCLQVDQLDPIEEIDSKKRRGLETTQRVSEYMRSTAKRVAQKTVTEAKTDEAPAAEKDQLDFSSEFTSQDMGLNSRGGFTPVLDWNRPVEEEDQQKEGDSEEQDPGSSQNESGQSGEEQEHDEGSEAVAPSPSVPSPAPHLEPPPVSPTTPSETAKKAVPTSETVSDQAPSAVSTVPESPAPTELSWDDPEDGLAETRPEATERTFRPVASGGLPLSLLERVRPVSHQVLPPSGQLAEIDPEIISTAGLLIATPADEPGYQECVRLLSRFGLGALRMCARNKVSVEILDDEGFASHPQLQALNLTPEQTPSDGAYLVASRVVLVDRRCLLSKPHFFHPALYYFAHAFDHAQGGEDFSSRKAAAVVACFEASTRGAGGFDIIDELAAADPVRYFARSVAVYLGRDDCLSPLLTHQDMYDFDRSMYDYLQYLFARFTT